MLKVEIENEIYKQHFVSNIHQYSLALQLRSNTDQSPHPYNARPDLAVEEEDAGSLG